MTLCRRSFSVLYVGIAFCLIVTQIRGADDRDTGTRLQQIAAKYSLKIVVTQKAFRDIRRHGVVSGGPASKLELASYSPLFAFEFSLYPVDVVKKSRLKGIVLCKDLSFAGQRRNAVPDFEHNLLYLDVARGRYSDSYRRKVIHHEFFHIIDWRDDGKLYKDDQWATMNPRGFAYGRGGRNAQDDLTVSIINDKQPGFLNKYSTTGVEEDKAELFANIIVDWEAVAHRAARDKVIALKVERMQTLMQEFSPAAGKDFWNRIRKLNRPRVK